MVSMTSLPVRRTAAALGLSLAVLGLVPATSAGASGGTPGGHGHGRGPVAVTETGPVRGAASAGGPYVCVYGARSRDVTCLRAGPTGFHLAGRFAGPQNAVKFGVQQNLALTADGRYAFAASPETGEVGNARERGTNAGGA